MGGEGLTSGNTVMLPEKKRKGKKDKARNTSGHFQTNPRVCQT